MTSPYTPRVTEFWNRLLNQRDLQVLVDRVDPEVEWRGSIGLIKHGHAGIQEYVEHILTSFPDYHAELEAPIVDGNRAAISIVFKGTHEGAFMELPATGQPMAYGGVALMDFDPESQLLTRIWVMGDLYGLRKQLGA